MKKLICLIFFVLVSSGCATTLKPGMIWMNTPPSVKYEKDPEVSFDVYKNFSVLPQAGLDKENKINPIEEKQILFILRNHFESLGYSYVNDVKEADFLVLISYSNEYKTQYIPPSSYTIPWYVPGQTQTTFINSYNNVSGNIGSTYFHGTGSGSGTATTTTPGQYVPITVTKPGGYTGSYYPCFIVYVFDKNLKKLIWSGSVVGATSTSDIRLSGQAVLKYLFGKRNPNFPVNRDAIKKDDTKDGAFGIWLSHPCTLDGNNFYPYIFGIAVNSPAYKQNLKPGEFIVKMDKQETLNWSFSQLIDAMNKGKGESLIVTTVQRDGKLLDVNLIAEDEEVAKNNWKETVTFNEQGYVQRIKIPK
ncbi:MAG: DUF4136 domain-containing protein [Candidatus Omnitrophota bacterium]|nr:DUF4136 domain-containing protein [Candidatus Omnitrophota bacterium]